MYQRILVPVDGSPTATRGLQEAITLASKLGSVLRLLYIVDLHMLYMDAFGMGMLPESIALLQTAGEEVLTRAKQLADDQAVKAETRITECRAPTVADMIIEEAEHWHADLIVMGTHGRRGVRHVVMGSDAEDVVRRAGVPVLLLRAK